MIRESLLSQIKTENLVKFTLSQNDLEINFQIIIEALRQNESSL
jgi:hypothetical protein